MNINELEELAKSATPGPWLCDWSADEVEDENEPADVSVWQHKLFTGKLVNNVCSDNSITDGNYIAAANPSAILELIAAYREAVDALWVCAKHNELFHGKAHNTVIGSLHALATAKRLGVK